MKKKKNTKKPTTKTKTSQKSGRKGMRGGSLGGKTRKCGMCGKKGHNRRTCLGGKLKQ